MKLYWIKYKYLAIAFVLVFAMSSLSVYLLVSRPATPPQKPIDPVFNPAEKIINNDTKIFLKEYFPICEKYYSDCGDMTEVLGDARENLNSKNISQVREQYPREQGWDIEWDKERLIIIKKNSGLCNEHMRSYHLLPDEFNYYVCIYFGPSVVGREGGLYRKTDLKITDIPGEYQEKVRKGELEFYSEEELISSLDSLSEYAE